VSTNRSDAPIQIRVDAGQCLGELPHNWNYIGYDECNYTYTPEGQELLAKFGALGEKPYYVRAHHLFCTGNCHGVYKWGSTNVYLEGDDGQPIYNWTFMDLILDTILKHRCKPFVELGFMPLDLVAPTLYDRSKDTANFRVYQTTGWNCPPKDYDRWHDLVYNLVRRCADRYGTAEVATWYWELWNEPDIFYWRGTIEEYNKLYDTTASAVKAACPQARIGGPSTTNPNLERNSGKYLDSFLDHCVNGTNCVTGQKGTALDFVTFHVKGGGYRADPLHKKQNPPSVKQIVRDVGIGYDILSKYPGLTQLECVLSEIDPDGWAAGGAWDNANLNFRNTEYYPSYVACAFDKLTRWSTVKGWDLKFLTWAFMFVGERCFEGTRAFSTQGIDKAILNLFRMYARMGTQQVAFESTGAKDPLQYADLWGLDETSDVSGFATLTGNKSMELLIYNHHDDWNKDEQVEVEVEVRNLPFGGERLSLQHYRVDATHSNAYSEWVRQGKPMYPAPGQYAAIKARDGLELVEPPQKVLLMDGKVKLSFKLPVHGISLLILSPSA
jgi:xylan 1,4-beta-xylosidase